MSRLSESMVDRMIRLGESYGRRQGWDLGEFGARVPMDSIDWGFYPNPHFGGAFTSELEVWHNDVVHVLTVNRSMLIVDIAVVEPDYGF